MERVAPFMWYFVDAPFDRSALMFSVSRGTEEQDWVQMYDIARDKLVNVHKTRLMSEAPFPASTEDQYRKLENRVADLMIQSGLVLNP